MTSSVLAWTGDPRNKRLDYLQAFEFTLAREDPAAVITRSSHSRSICREDGGGTSAQSGLSGRSRRFVQDHIPKDGRGSARCVDWWKVVQNVSGNQHRIRRLHPRSRFRMVERLWEVYVLRARRRLNAEICTESKHCRLVRRAARRRLPVHIQGGVYPSAPAKRQRVNRLSVS